MNPVDIPRIDLNLLAVFQAIYAERHLTRAGNRLGLTQPAMSHALNRLRGLFDDALFVRTAAGMEPTPRAHQIAEPVGAALAQVRRALARPDRFDPATARQAFRLSMLDYETAVVVPPLAACFAATAPGIDLRIRHARRTDALDLLDRNELDVALGLFDDLPARFEPRALFDESFAVIARADHPDLSGGLTLDAYVRLPHLLVSFDGTPHGTIDDVLAREGLARRVALTLPYFLTAPLVIAATDMIATLPARIAALFRQTHGIAVLPLPVTLRGYTLSAVRHRRSAGDPAVQWLLDTLESVTREAGNDASGIYRAAG
jgi:DNA-binding transcriptional LysR family regulator